MEPAGAVEDPLRRPQPVGEAGQHSGRDPHRRAVREREPGGRTDRVQARLPAPRPDRDGGPRQGPELRQAGRGSRHHRQRGRPGHVHPRRGRRLRSPPRQLPRHRRRRLCPGDGRRPLRHPRRPVGPLRPRQRVRRNHRVRRGRRGHRPCPGLRPPDEAPGRPPGRQQCGGGPRDPLPLRSSPDRPHRHRGGSRHRTHRPHRGDRRRRRRARRRPHLGARHQTRRRIHRRLHRPRGQDDGPRRRDRLRFHRYGRGQAGRPGSRGVAVGSTPSETARLVLARLAART